MVLFGLPVIMLVLWLPSFISEKLLPIANSTPLFELINIQNPLINKLVAFTIILFTGILLNVQINKNEIFERNTYTPALFYVLIMSCFSDLHQIHPIVVSNLFWVLAYRRLLNIYNQVQCKSEIFDASLFILLGAFFCYPTSGILILLPWLTLIIIRPFDFKEYMIPLFGMLLLLLYWSSYFYISESSFEILKISKRSSYTNFEVQFNWSHYVAYGMITVLMYLSGYKLINKSNSSSVRFRKTTSVLLSFLTLVIGIMSIDKYVLKNDAFILYAAVPFSILWSFFFFYNEKKWIGSLVFYILLVLLIINIYFKPFLANLSI